MVATYLSGNELAQMRADALMLLADTCTIGTRTETVDELGTPIITWTDTANVACKLAAQTSKNPGTGGGQFQVSAGWVLTVAFDQAIAGDNQVTVNGKGYTVLAVEDDQTWGIVKRAYMRREG